MVVLRTRSALPTATPTIPLPCLRLGYKEGRGAWEFLFPLLARPHPSSSSRFCARSWFRRRTLNWFCDEEDSAALLRLSRRRLLVPALSPVSSFRSCRLGFPLDLFVSSLFVRCGSVVVPPPFSRRIATGPRSSKFSSAASCSSGDLSGEIMSSSFSGALVEDDDAGSGPERGSWQGSSVTRREIEWLIRTRRIPAEVSCRLPGNELSPEIREGEYVVFMSHFSRGFGLPLSDFAREFLDYFGLQPHHLPANAIASLSAFISASEGYFGLWPSVHVWSKFFQIRSNVVPDKSLHPSEKLLTQCGAASITPRRKSVFPRVTGLESCKKWHKSFFYVKNRGTEDKIRLPAFSIGPPSKVNWTYNPRRSHVLAELFETRLKELIRAGLRGEDLMATFISSRICPFQKRTHKLCYMSGPLDPNRVSTVELDNYLVFKRVRAIFKTEMPEDWAWGLKPFTREHPPPAVSLTINALIFYCFHSCFR